MTEIFWDPQAVGEDEVGNRAPGMYRYVAGGKRYLPGQHPTTEPNVFKNEGAADRVRELARSSRSRTTRTRTTTPASNS